MDKNFGRKFKKKTFLVTARRLMSLLLKKKFDFQTDL